MWTDKNVIFISNYRQAIFTTVCARVSTCTDAGLSSPENIRARVAKIKIPDLTANIGNSINPPYIRVEPYAYVRDVELLIFQNNWNTSSSRAVYATSSVHCVRARALIFFPPSFHIIIIIIQLCFTAIRTALDESDLCSSRALLYFIILRRVLSILSRK